MDLQEGDSEASRSSQLEPAIEKSAATGLALPKVEQAEAYYEDRCVLIRNARTERVVEHTRSVFGEKLQQARDLEGFLDAIAGVIDNAEIVVALGDSTTANIHNWPYSFATRHRRDGKPVVLNLADWARRSELHVGVLEYILPRLRQQGAADIDVVLVLGMRDINDRLHFYDGFVSQGRATALSPEEEALTQHRHGTELARLAAEVPEDWQAAERWIARRITAGVKMMARICRNAGCRFFAILEPSAYADCSPGYRHTLRRTYQGDAAAAAMPFEEWLNQRHFVRDPSIFGPHDHRPVLDELRRLWQGQAEIVGDAYYLDWSGLFRGESECCFQSQFDAVHYDTLGAGIIADALSAVLAAAREGRSTVSQIEAERRRTAVDRWLASVQDRLADPDLEPGEIDYLFKAFVECYAPTEFPATLEKRALEGWVALYPERDDLRTRLNQLEAAARA